MTSCEASMRTMKASEFKSKCLQVLDEVQATGEPVQVTKRGRVVARVVREERVREESVVERLLKVFPNAGKGGEITDFDVKEGLREEWARWERKLDDLYGPQKAEGR
jgi:prevent-host-death family protein